MGKKENIIVLIIFIIGSGLFFWKIYKSPESNFYVLTLFLVAILALILFKDNLEEFSLLGNLLRMKLRKLKLSKDDEEISEEASNLTLKKFKAINISGVEK